MLEDLSRLAHGYDVAGLDDKLKTLLPALTYSKPAKANIKLRDLLTMSAGFDWVEDQTEYDEWWQRGVEVYEPYAEYKPRAEAAGRTIPLFVLEPVD